MKKKMIFIGNSIVAGYPWSKGKSFTGYLRRALKGGEDSLPQPDFAKQVGFDIVNKGINGDTTDGIARRFQTDVLDGHPDAVFFMTGTNDFIFRDSTPEEAFERLESLADTAQNMGILPIYITPIRVDAGKAEYMWMAGFGVSYPAVNRDVDRFSELLRQSGRLYVDMNAAFAEYAKTIDDVDLVYLDGVHPMPDGHQFMAEEIIRFLEANRNALGF